MMRTSGIVKNCALSRSFTCYVLVYVLVIENDGG